MAVTKKVEIEVRGENDRGYKLMLSGDRVTIRNLTFKAGAVPLTDLRRALTELEATAGLGE